MNYKISDVLLVLVIVLIPLFGIAQSCDLNGGGTAPPNNQPPVPVVRIVGDDNGPGPLSVTFDGSESYDPDEGPIEFIWYFSDGTYDAGPTVEHTFTESGRHEACLFVKDVWGVVSESEPSQVYVWGLANSPWPKYAHDIRNTGVTSNLGPVKDNAHADEGGAFPRYWRGGFTDGRVNAICVGYDGVVFYTQGNWLRAKTSDGLNLWNFDAGSIISTWPAIMYDGSIIFGTAGGSMFKLSQSGEQIWRYDSGGKYVFGPVVTIDNQCVIYVASINSDRKLYETHGYLHAFEMNGNEKWVVHLPSATVRNQYGLSSIIPAIQLDGNIVVNGGPGYLISPDGFVIRQLEYVRLHGASFEFLGAPAISAEGFIIFAHETCPIFYPDGYFYTTLNDKASEEFLNPDVPPVLSENGFSLPMYKFNGSNNNYSIYAVTYGDGGGIHELPLTPVKNMPYGGLNLDLALRGSCQDGYGRVFQSNNGLYAVSPIAFSSIYPHTIRRYSMWSYHRDSWVMTAPVIGEDGWLYVGYGNDIMALGD